ncbi:hypothetical protein C6501_07840 [Candidatus Poribacteria bacterium]|nr:MAG: hypothetical protein C6501_07840 [Candidatus Poribacteria bacterium]
MKLLIFLLLVSVSSVLGCDADIEGILDPCLIEVGEEFRTTAYYPGKPRVVYMPPKEGCYGTIVLRIANPRQVHAGSRILYKVLKRNSEHSYDVRILKVWN